MQYKNQGRLTKILLGYKWLATINELAYNAAVLMIKKSFKMEHLDFHKGEKTSLGKIKYTTEDLYITKT